MPNSGVFRGFSQVPGLDSFLLRRHVLPEKRHAERTVGTVERTLQRFEVIHVGRNDFGTELGKRPGFVGVDVSCQSTGRELSAWIGKDGADQPATLASSCACHRDDFLFHKASSDVKSMKSNISPFSRP